MLTDSPFDASRFARRCRETIDGAAVRVSRPEDTILAKLRWARLAGGSEKQFGDALRVYEVQFAQLDRDYLEEWAQALGVTDLWERVKREALPIE